MTTHFLRINEAGVHLVCTATPDAPCRAYFDCDCETWVVNDWHDAGRPTHTPEGCDEHHIGEWGNCSIEEWWDAMIDPFELVHGELDVPVTVEWWDDDGLELHLHTAPPTPTLPIDGEARAV